MANIEAKYEEAKQTAQQIRNEFNHLFDYGRDAGMVAVVLAILAKDYANQLKGGFAVKKRYIDSIGEVAKDLLNKGE